MITLRQTILQDFQQCSYKCYMGWGEVGELGKYDKQPSPQNKYSACGIAFHEVMEYAGRSIIDKNERVPLNFLLTLMEEKLYDIPFEMFDNDEEERETWRISLLEQVKWTHEQKLMSNNLIEVEYNFTIENMFEGMPPFTGTIDGIEGNLEAKDVTIFDYKTGKKYTKKKVQDSIQACIYSLAFYHKYGFLPKEFIFIFSKTKHKMSLPITFDFINRVSAEIVRIVTEMRNGHFEPNCNSKFFCNHFCEFYDECPKYKRNKKQGWDAVLEVKALGL